MNAKRVLIIVLIVSLLGISTVQSVSAVGLESSMDKAVAGQSIAGEDDVPPSVSQAFDIDDIDSPDIQSSAIGIIIMEKLRDISDED